MAARKNRKKWKLTYRPAGDPDQFISQKATYEFVRTLARWKAAGATDVEQVTVWLDEGDGREWQRYEVLDLAELAVTWGS